MKIEVGKTYIYKGKTVKCTAKWAQGVWYTYTFDDGSSFNGDAASMFASGEIQNVQTEELPQVKINRVRPWTPKIIDRDENGKTSES